MAAMYGDPVAINAASAAAPSRSVHVNKDSRAYKDIPSLLVTVINVPVASGVSTRDMSWLKRFTVSPVGVAVKND